MSIIIVLFIQPIETFLFKSFITSQLQIVICNSVVSSLYTRMLNQYYIFETKEKVMRHSNSHAMRDLSFHLRDEFSTTNEPREQRKQV